VPGKSAAAPVRLAGFTLSLAAALLFPVALPSQTPQQSASPAAAPPAPAASTPSAELMSFSGIWMSHAPPGPKIPDYSITNLTRGELPLTDWGKTKFAEAKPTFGPKAYSISESNEPTFQCFPPGVPAIYTYLYPVQIVPTTNEVVMLYEYDHQVRHVYTDGRPHPPDVQPTWMGHSIGHMDGDAFVIDTVGFNDKSWLDRFGHPHSDQLHLTERLQHVGDNFLRIDFTFDDPKAYTKTWTSQLFFQHKPSWELLEYLCTDNLKFLNFEKILNAPATKQP
jgi:hypothetical protein